MSTATRSLRKVFRLEMRVDLREPRFFTGWMRKLLLVCGLILAAATGCFNRKKDTDALFSPAPFVGGTNETNISGIVAKPVPFKVTNAATNDTERPTPTPAVTQAVTGSGTQTNRIVVPAEGLAGKVASFNSTGKFVVISFPIGQMPAYEQRMSVYRRGLKVGEVKITGPKLDENIVADLSEGAAEAGDDVRDR